MKKLGIILLLILIPSFSFARTGFIGSGFGYSPANGTYCDSGDTFNLTPIYTNENGENIFSNTMDTRWYLSQTIQESQVDYYSDAGNTLINNPFELNPWTANDQATAGEFSETTCEEETGTSTPETTNATSTIAYLGSIAFGQAIIITLLFLGFIGYIYNSIHTKKPWQK